jgi:CheY-like chemotaxis protein
VAVVSDLLGKEHYRIVAVASDPASVQRVVAEGPAVVLLDVITPGPKGRETMVLRKSDAEAPNLDRNHSPVDSG